MIKYIDDPLTNRMMCRVFKNCLIKNQKALRIICPPSIPTKYQWKCKRYYGIITKRTSWVTTRNGSQQDIKRQYLFTCQVETEETINDRVLPSNPCCQYENEREKFVKIRTKLYINCTMSASSRYFNER